MATATRGDAMREFSRAVLREAEVGGVRGKEETEPKPPRRPGPFTLDIKVEEEDIILTEKEKRRKSKRGAPC